MVVNVLQSPENPKEKIRLDSAAWRKDAAAYLWQAGLGKQSDELICCCDPARAWQALACPDNHEKAYQVVVPSCKLSYCPMCGHARSAEVARDYTPIVQDALNASPDTHRLRHIVLTTPYSIEHSKIVQLTGEFWKKAVQFIEAATGIKQRNWKKQDIGVLGGWEFGGKGLKLHLHMLVLCPYIKQEKLVKIWKHLTQGICEVVDIRQVESVESGVREVTKYATKLTALPPKHIVTLHTVLTGKRRIRAFGAFSCKIKHQESEPMTCPVCGKELLLVPLLQSRPGNNFAHDHVTNPANVPQEAAIPPPEQLELPLTGQYRPETFKFFN